MCFYLSFSLSWEMVHVLSLESRGWGAAGHLQPLRLDQRVFGGAQETPEASRTGLSSESVGPEATISRSVHGPGW